MVLDASQVAKFRDVRNEYFKSDPPASTALEVRALLRPEYLVEMDVIAVAKVENGLRRASAWADQPLVPGRAALRHQWTCSLRRSPARESPRSKTIDDVAPKGVASGQRYPPAMMAALNR